MAFTLPTNPTVGQTFTLNNAVYSWNGTAWDGVAGGINVSDTVPATTSTGALWYESDVGKLKVYYSGAWVDASPGAINNRQMVSAYVNAGVYVQMDNLSCGLTTSGQRGLSLAAVTGTFSSMIGGSYSLVGGSGGTTTNGLYSVTTTPSTSLFAWSFPGQGDISIYILTDITNSRTYRITLQIGGGYVNNFISIERLI